MTVKEKRIMLVFRKSSVIDDIPDEHGGTNDEAVDDQLTITSAIMPPVRPPNPYYPISGGNHVGVMQARLLGLPIGSFPIFAGLKDALNNSRIKPLPTAEEYQEIVKTGRIRRRPEKPQTGFHSILGSYGVTTEYPNVEGTPDDRKNNRVPPASHFFPDELTSKGVPIVPEGYSLPSSYYENNTNANTVDL